MIPDKKKASPCDIITTPFPYAYLDPHVGNLYQLWRGHLIKDIRNAYYESGLYSKKTYYSYRGLHLTGLPIYLLIKSINQDLKVQNLEKALEKRSMSYFYKYVPNKNIKELNLKIWFEILKNYYSEITDALDIDNSVPNKTRNDWYGTTDVNLEYHSFVNEIYKALKEKNLIVQDYNYVLYCNHCSNIVGDHDRKNYEGHGTLKVNAYVYQSKGEDYVLGLKDQQKFLKTPLGFLGTNLIAKICKTLPKEISSLNLITLKTPCSIKFDLKEIQNLEVLEKKTPILEETFLYYSVGDILCRCGNFADIKSEKTLFIDFKNQAWKVKVKKAIEDSKNDTMTKNLLFKASEELNKVSFLRTSGYGSKLDILKGTPYENCLVDSLTDSPLFAYFSSNPTSVFSSSSGHKYICHLSGKDLLKNHILYFIYFSTMLTDLEIPVFVLDGHLVDENNLKMSKTLGNAIFYQDLIKLNLNNKCMLNSCFTQITDSYDNKKLVLKNIVALNKADLKRKENLLMLLDNVDKKLLLENKIIKKALESIANEMHLIIKNELLETPNLNYENLKNKKFRIRYTKHQITHVISTQLKQIQKRINSDSKISDADKLIKLLKLLVTALI